MNFEFNKNAKSSRKQVWFPSFFRIRKKRKSKNRYDNFAQSFYTKAQNSFLKIAKNKKNYFVLESSANDNLLEKKILKITCKYLGIK